MAVSNYQFKLGSALCELVTGITFSDTNETSFTHYLGVQPDITLIIPTSAYHVYMSTATSSTTIKLTPANASATCQVLLIKAKDKEIA